MNTTSHWFKSHLKDMPRDECVKVLASRQVGRVVFIDSDGPIALPVNYVMRGDTVLFATSPTNSLAKNVVDRQVALEVDEIDEFNETGWSVLLRGRASKAELGDLLTGDQPVPWAEGDRTLVVRISPSQISGRYLLPA